jgi:hypothetical protein
MLQGQPTPSTATALHATMARRVHFANEPGRYRRTSIAAFDRHRREAFSTGYYAAFLILMVLAVPCWIASAVRLKTPHAEDSAFFFLRRAAAEGFVTASAAARHQASSE